LQNVETAYEYFFSHPEEEGEYRAVILNYLSEIYLEGYGDDRRAEAYAREALLLLEDLAIPREKSVSLRLLSTIHLTRGEWVKAEETALSALSADASEPANTLALYNILAKACAHLGKASQAAEYIDKQQALQSLWSNKNYQSAIREMEVKYETAKKEHEIAQQQHTISRANLHRRLLATFAGVLLLGMAVLFLVWRWTVQKRRLAEHHIKELKQQQQLVAVQAVLDGEIQERIRIARDLHDSLGSILAGTKLNLQEMKKVSQIADGHSWRGTLPCRPLST